MLLLCHILRNFWFYRKVACASDVESSDLAANIDALTRAIVALEEVSVGVVSSRGRWALPSARFPGVPRRFRITIFPRSFHSFRTVAEAIGILKLFMDEMSADLAAQKAEGDQKASRAASTRRRRSPC